MSKEYNGISGEPIAIITNSVTCSIEPKLQLPEKKDFAQVIGRKESLVTMWLNNYKTNSRVKYNLSVDDMKYLADAASICSLRRPFSGTKIWSDYPAKEGEYVGLCPTFHIKIYRMDKASDGSLMRNPWTIQIENGYAKAKGKVEETGTFKCTGSVKISLTDKDFASLTKQYLLYEEQWRKLPFVEQAFAEGYQSYKEARNERDSRRNYGVSKPSTNRSSTSQKSAAAPGPVGLPKGAKPATAKLVGDFIVYEDSDLPEAECEIQGKVYPVVFDSIPKELEDTSKTGDAFEGIFYPKGGKVHFLKLVS